jgi:hypothetical protein
MIRLCFGRFRICCKDLNTPATPSQAFAGSFPKHRDIGKICRKVPDAVVCFPVNLIAGGNEDFSGTFEGSGRACYGKLVTKPKTISWNTPFSSCKDLPYDVIQNDTKGSERRNVYLLKKRNKGCLFGVISLRHRESAERDLNWEATGYLSLEDSKADNAANSTSCYLYQIK